MNNATESDTFLPNRRLRRILPVVIASVALVGAASPALAQDPPLSDYNPTTSSSEKTPPPPTTTEKKAPTPVPEDNSGVQGEQADGESQPAPAVTNAAPVAPAAAPAASVGSTGRPARLAFTGAEPLIVGLLGGVMLMGAGLVYRRRQLN